MIGALLQRYCQQPATLPHEAVAMLRFFVAVLFAGASISSLLALMDKSVTAVALTGLFLFFGILLLLMMVQP